MFSPRIPIEVITKALAAMLLFVGMAAAQIPGLCNTGQTTATSAGCTGVLVTPNPTGGGPNRDGNWGLTYRPLGADHNACLLPADGFVYAWVDTPISSWLPNSVSTASRWITRYDGESNVPEGWYAYKTAFHVPRVLPGGAVPTGVIINGQVASDNATFTIYLESPANSDTCALVSGQHFPVNTYNGATFQEWWPFSFTNSLAITPGADAYVYFVVENEPCPAGCGGPGDASATGLRVEFFASSAFN